MVGGFQSLWIAEGGGEMKFVGGRQSWDGVLYVFMLLAGDWGILDSGFVRRGGGKSQKVGRSLENEIFD